MDSYLKELQLLLIICLKQKHLIYFDRVWVYAILKKDYLIIKVINIFHQNLYPCCEKHIHMMIHIGINQHQQFYNYHINQYIFDLILDYCDSFKLNLNM